MRPGSIWVQRDKSVTRAVFLKSMEYWARHLTGTAGCTGIGRYNVARSPISTAILAVSSRKAAIGVVECSRSTG